MVLSSKRRSISHFLEQMRSMHGDMISIYLSRYLSIYPYHNVLYLQCINEFIYLWSLNPSWSQIGGGVPSIQHSLPTPFKGGVYHPHPTLKKVALFNKKMWSTQPLSCSGCDMRSASNGVRWDWLQISNSCSMFCVQELLLNLMVVTDWFPFPTDNEQIADSTIKVSTTVQGKVLH